MEDKLLRLIEETDIKDKLMSDIEKYLTKLES